MDDTLKKLNDVVVKLERVNNGMNVLNSVVGKSLSLRGGTTSSSRETGHVLTADVVVGREEDKEKVLNWLTMPGCDSQESRNISALTILGIGGVGKTTLAQSVYNDTSLSFQVKMWVCVSNNNLSMLEITKKAIGSKTGSHPTVTTLPSLQDEIENLVASKKCLLVLDDVWGDQLNQNQQEWEKFIGLFNYAERGSKILVTTRDKDVTDNILPGSCPKTKPSLPNLIHPLRRRSRRPETPYTTETTPPPPSTPSAEPTTPKEAMATKDRDNHRSPAR